MLPVEPPSFVSKETIVQLIFNRMWRHFLLDDSDTKICRVFGPRCFILTWHFLAPVRSALTERGSSCEGLQVLWFTIFPSLKLWSGFSWFGKLFVILIAVFLPLFSVTFPGTHAGRSVLTRGKPILLCSLFFPRFLGFLGVAFWTGVFFGFVGFFAFHCLYSYYL